MSGKHADLIARLRRLAPGRQFPDVLTEAADVLEGEEMVWEHIAELVSRDLTAALERKGRDGWEPWHLETIGPRYENVWKIYFKRPTNNTGGK